MNIRTRAASNFQHGSRVPEHSSWTSPSGSRASPWSIGFSKFRPVSQRQPGSCCGQLATTTATDARQRRRAHERENPSKRTIKEYYDDEEEGGGIQIKSKVAAAAGEEKYGGN